RDRGFAETDKYTPAKGLELARFVDLLFLYLLGELKDDDEILARNWWTGHQEKVKVSTIVQSIRDGFRLRQSLRAHEQDQREEVEQIFNDNTKSIEESIHAIEQKEVKPNLDLDEHSTREEVEQKLTARRARRQVQ